MPNGALSQPPWMPHAWAGLGEREIAGPASNPRIADYIRRAGHPQAATDSTAWCAAFVGACLSAGGIPGTNSLLARSYLAWGVAVEPPTPGAVAILSRGADPTFGHVGFVVGMTDDRVVLLGGNQSDAVTVQAFPRSRVLGFRLPQSSLDPSPAAVPTAAADFTRSLAHILDFEGGWSDDPFDPGGATNRGITLAVYARAIGEAVTAESHGRLKAQLRDIPDALVRRIYLERYWQPAYCDQLPAPLAHFHFDCAVNQGVAGAARMLQEALGVDIDGEIGPLSLAAAGRDHAPEILERYAEIRRRRYRRLQHFWRFGRGWLARVDQALEQALGIARSDPVPATGTVPTPIATGETHPMPSPDQTASFPAAKHPTASPPSAKWWGNSLTIWGALLTAATTVAPAVFAAFGIDVPIDLVKRLGVDAVAVVQAIGGLAGTVMTIAGRARADTRLERRAIALHL